MAAAQMCDRCGRSGSLMEVGWGNCTTCGRLLCPLDVSLGCDGVTPAALADPVESVSERSTHAPGYSE